MEHGVRKESVFTLRIRMGLLIWICSVQYFIAEYSVQRQWKIIPYDAVHFAISDLGATRCVHVAAQLLHQVCSPWYVAMDASFIVSGCITILGTFLVWPFLATTKLAKIGLWSLVVGGIGVIAVGLFPENVYPTPHFTGALILFVANNLGLLLLGIHFLRRGWSRIFSFYTLALGLGGLFALLLLPFVTTSFPVIGVGLIERVVAYPLTIWLISAGTYLLSRSSVDH